MLAYVITAVVTQFIFFGVICAVIAGCYDRSQLNRFLLGGVFGLLDLIVIALLGEADPPATLSFPAKHARVACPSCRMATAGGDVCRNCGEPLPGPAWGRGEAAGSFRWPEDG